MSPKVNLDEVIVTDPDTGGQKGVKLERHDLMPEEALAEVAKVYGFGSEKYADHNWRKGYKWGYSYGAMRRHMRAFWSGEDFDPESDLPHMAHAVWHGLALLTFMVDHPEKDDRYLNRDRYLSPRQEV